jgi:hypothetical protein
MAAVCSTDAPSDVVVVAVAGAHAAVAVVVAVVVADVALASSVASSLRDLAAFFPRGFLTRWLAAGTAPLHVVRRSSVVVSTMVGGRKEGNGTNTANESRFGSCRKLSKQHRFSTYTRRSRGFAVHYVYVTLDYHMLVWLSWIVHLIESCDLFMPRGSIPEDGIIFDKDSVRTP